MSEPVAYGMLTFCKNCGEQNPYSLRELTDEEIQKLYEETSFFGVLDPIKFARAILRKAQE